MKRFLLTLSAMAVTLAAIACTQAKADELPQGDQWAIVNASRVYLRGEPRYSSECVSQSRMGTLVQVLERKGYWVRVQTPEPYEGWINEAALAPTVALPSDAQTDEYGPKLQPLTQEQARAYIGTPKYICTAEYTHIHAEPSEEAARICDFLMSDLVRKGSKTQGEWSEVLLADSRTGWVKTAEVADFKTWADNHYGTVNQADIISLARQFLGCPYMWGGMSVGQFDCSGLSGFCYFMNGVLLPRDASQQVKCGVEVAREEMQAGDLVFFGNTSVGHVAIALDNRHIIHSSQIVRINSLEPGDADYYGRNILNIRRIIGHIDTNEGAISIKTSPWYFE